MNGNRQWTLIAASVTATFLVIMLFAVNTGTLDTPLFTWRMEQASDKMGFSPTPVNGFSYDTEKGRVLGYEITEDEYGYVKPLDSGQGCEQDTREGEGCRDTQDDTCQTCEDTCEDTCADTCSDTCSTCTGETSCSTCPADTCSNIKTQCGTCTDTCSESCEGTCETCTSNCSTCTGGSSCGTSLADTYSTCDTCPPTFEESCIPIKCEPPPLAQFEQPLENICRGSACQYTYLNVYKSI